jgi:hypothetical protein
VIEVIRYTKDKKSEWDGFIDTSKNGTFLHKRDYIEYHANRFTDYSLLLYRKKRLIAVFPANIEEQSIYSHQGLTYGGLIVDYHNKTTEIIILFDALNTFLASNSINNVEIREIPHIYCSHFNDEIKYIMFLYNAQLTSCNLASVIDLKSPLKISRLRKRSLKKANESKLSIDFSEDYPTFWNIMDDNLWTKYKTKPVHSIKEIIHLKTLFPDNIKLVTAQKNNEIIAGAVIYIFDNVVKLQYAHASPPGKSVGAIDAIYSHLIDTFSKKFHYIDFGHSNEQNGAILNKGLINQKEGFGSRSIINNTYVYQLP